MKTIEIPKDGLEGLKQNWKVDAVSGFLVFLLALPLSLGIAKASEFPPAMGVLTAMIGGLIVGIFQGGRLTIKGPAAGLITVCAGAVIEFGGGVEGWRLALGVIVVTALIQIVLGFLKFGSLSDFFPHSAVHGMLAAIGIIIFVKQVPVLMGSDPSFAKGLSPIGLFTHIPVFVQNLDPHISFVGVVSLLILFVLPALNISLLKKVPAPLIVLFFAVPMGVYWHFKVDEPSYALVKIGNFWGDIGLNASFAGIGTFIFWKYVFMFLFVNSLESLLTVKAIDGLDPYRRKSDYDKDLTALGVGNAISGLLGGLPMISEVVRSGANVNFGARTRWANVFHGLFLFLAMLLVIPAIEMIPNAALAAMLIYAGYRLASPKEFIGTYRIGPEQLVIFLVTIAVTVAEDLLLGVACGILVKFIFHIFNGATLKTLFKAWYDFSEKGDTYIIKVKGVATFSNFLGYKKLWKQLKPGKNVEFDFSEARLVDHSFMDQLHHFEEDYTYAGGHVLWTGLEKFNPFSNHPLAARKASASSPSKFEMKLNQRQMELQQFATTNDLIFYPQKIRSALKFRNYPIEKGSKIVYEENVLSKYTDFGKVEISDITVSEGTGMGHEDTIITVIHVSDLEAKIPNFSLEPERLWTKLSELSFGKDIDFKDHPGFSSKYYLRGDDEVAVRKFFQEEIISFFEASPVIHIESHKNKLLVYEKRATLSTSEIMSALTFVEGLANAVNKPVAQSV